MINVGDLPPREYWLRIGRIINGRLYSYSGLDYASFHMRDGALIEVPPAIAHVIELLSITLGDVGDIAVQLADVGMEAASRERSSRRKDELISVYTKSKRMVRGILNELPAIVLEPDNDEDEVPLDEVID
jgi:hypothetical protein